MQLPECFLIVLIYLYRKILVMDTVTLKKEIYRTIYEIEDVELLKAIQTLLNFRKKARYIDLSDEMTEEIKMAQEQARQGLVVSEKDLDLKFEQWLGEK